MMTETQSDQVDNIRQAWVASEALLVGYEAVLAELVLNAWLIKQAVIVQQRINSKKKHSRTGLPVAVGLRV